MSLGTIDDPIGVFLLDDHEVVRRGVRDLLEAEEGIEVVGEAGTAAEALARVPAARPDVAVLDVVSRTAMRSRSSARSAAASPRWRA